MVREAARRRREAGLTREVVVAVVGSLVVAAAAHSLVVAAVGSLAVSPAQRRGHLPRDASSDSAVQSSTS